ncbi:restriction endonuclease subunit S [Rufibacter latericius]|uniref:restriction endonuclease subunit S n=1 Tax=Rufibacter latericius TaxID=2487040 RepID=UPI001403DA5A|nr:restriction endonuclease subunit S [Rufibacter latericius]
MKRYDSYKDSHVEYLGEIPEHWELKKLKYVAQVNPSKSRLLSEVDQEQFVTFLPMEKVSENGEIDTTIKKPIKELASGFTIFQENDVILAKITPCFENGKGAYLKNLGSPLGFGSTEFHVLRAHDQMVLNEYLFYVTKSNLFMELGEASMTGSAGQKRVPTSYLQEYLLPYPSDLAEQESIVQFIKAKDSQISTLIQKKQQMIALLEEEKTAVINEAVTKGLNQDVPMKESKVEWLGVVPAHWEVKSIKNICSVRQGLQIPIENRISEHVEGSYEYITIKSINNPESYKEYIKDPSERVICDHDDILVARTGATGEIIKGVRGVFHNNFFLVDYDRSQVTKDYLYYYLKNRPIKDYLLLVAGTTTIPDLNHGAFYSTVFLQPPLEEQQEITTYIISKIEESEQLLDKMRKEISLLQEYRTALISEAVTGKIDVRYYQPAQIASSELELA